MKRQAVWGVLVSILLLILDFKIVSHLITNSGTSIYTYPDTKVNPTPNTQLNIGKNAIVSKDPTVQYSESVDTNVNCSLNNEVNVYLNINKDFNTGFNSDNVWRLVWCDEFDGNEINNKYWTLQNGGGIWGNNELQYYTDRPENCFVKDGRLVIRAIKEAYQKNQYTSARIITKEKVDFLYGKIDIKAKLPTGVGLLPAFWLLPCEDTYSDRKKNGEIDIMEMLGNNPKIVYAVAHYSLADKNKTWGKYDNADIDFSKDFHIYSLEWSQQELKWLVDNKLYYSMDLERTFDTDYNPFTKRFYLIMNFAVGGDWPGTPLNKTVFPSDMEIEYVRYYKK